MTQLDQVLSRAKSSLLWVALFTTAYLLSLCLLYAGLNLKNGELVWAGAFFCGIFASIEFFIMLLAVDFCIGQETERERLRVAVGENEEEDYVRVPVLPCYKDCRYILIIIFEVIGLTHLALMISWVHQGGFTVAIAAFLFGLPVYAMCVLGCFYMWRIVISIKILSGYRNRAEPAQLWRVFHVGNQVYFARIAAQEEA